MKIAITFIFTVLFLVSCGQRLVYENPEAEYRNCLRENAGDESRCEASKAAYEQEAQQFFDEAPDADPGGN